MTAEWIRRYNEQRPHESLGNVSPTAIPDGTIPLTLYF